MGVTKRGFKRFADWVDSHGVDAGDRMMIGAVCGGLVAGTLAFFVGLALSLVVLASIGFAVMLTHIGFVLAVDF